MPRSASPRYAADERAAIADTLAAVGPAAPTCCEGWLSRHLAAHLVLREHRPLAALGIVVPALSGVTDRVQRRLADGDGDGDYADLVDAVRARPRWGPTRLDRVDEAANLVEFFVHHEDVRRAGSEPAVPESAGPARAVAGSPRGWRPRVLAPGYAAALWRRVPMLARVQLAGSPRDVTLRAPGHGEVTVRSRRRARGGPAGPEPTSAPGVRTIVGDPGELLLYLFGRRSVAEVTIVDGDGTDPVDG